MRNAALLPAVLGVLGASLAFTSLAAPRSDDACSLRTLKGSYVYSIQGYRGGKPYASSGFMAFDGAGKAAVVYTSSIERRQLTVGGSYTVDGNCFGVMNLATSTINHFYLSPDGDRFEFVRVSDDDVIGATATRVTRAFIVKQP